MKVVGEGSDNSHRTVLPGLISGVKCTCSRSHVYFGLKAPKLNLWDCNGGYSVCTENPDGLQDF